MHVGMCVKYRTGTNVLILLTAENLAGLLYSLLSSSVTLIFLFICCYNSTLSVKKTLFVA